MTSQAIPDDPCAELARELNTLREQAHIPLRELGERCQFSKSTLHDAIKGERVPTKAVVLRFVQSCTQAGGRRYREEQERKFLRLWEKADLWKKNRSRRNQEESS